MMTNMVDSGGPREFSKGGPKSAKNFFFARGLLIAINFAVEAKDCFVSQLCVLRQ